MNPLYHLTSIQKLYGTKVALDVPELTVPRGGLHVLTGPNGSGKSTLLNILALLTRPERGQMEFAGVAVDWKGTKELVALRRRVTLLHQHEYLFSGSVFSNVAFGLKVRGVEKEEIRRSVQASLALVGLAGFENRNGRHLSGGEARRVALARALTFKPEVVLLDEPLTHVDKESEEIIGRLVLALCDTGTTIIMSSHHDQFHQRLAHVSVELVDGRIERITRRSAQAAENHP
jgi:tungstate transport system ATP-binding protein